MLVPIERKVTSAVDSFGLCDNFIRVVSIPNTYVVCEVDQTLEQVYEGSFIAYELVISNGRILDYELRCELKTILIGSFQGDQGAKVLFWVVDAQDVHMLVTQEAAECELCNEG